MYYPNRLGQLGLLNLLDPLIPLLLPVQLCLLSLLNRLGL
jgi:hypothetical protein